MYQLQLPNLTLTHYLAEWSSKLPSNRSNVITELPPHGSRIVFELYGLQPHLLVKTFQHYVPMVEPHFRQKQHQWVNQANH